MCIYTENLPTVTSNTITSEIGISAPKYAISDDFEQTAANCITIPIFNFGFGAI